MDSTTSGVQAFRLQTQDLAPVTCEQFMCDNLAQCYSVAQLCDGTIDCDDATDEKSAKCNAPGIGKGGTAGIVFGALVIAVVLLSVCVCYFRHRSRARKKRVIEAEELAIQARRAYREEVRRRETLEAENTNQIAFQTFGDPPSYEDVLNSPDSFPQSRSAPPIEGNQEDGASEHGTDTEGTRNNGQGSASPVSIGEETIVPNPSTSLQLVDEDLTVTNETSLSRSVTDETSTRAGISNDNVAANDVQVQLVNENERRNTASAERKNTKEGIPEAAPLLSSSRENLRALTLPRNTQNADTV